MNEAISSDLIRGHIDTIIMRVLRKQDSYGYEIIRSVTLFSSGQYELKEPSLYSSLKRLEKASFIRSYWGDESQGGRRKYYTITQKGTEAYENAVHEWRNARNLINRLIDDKFVE